MQLPHSTPMTRTRGSEGPRIKRGNWFKTASCHAACYRPWCSFMRDVVDKPAAAAAAAADKYDGGGEVILKSDEELVATRVGGDDGGRGGRSGRRRRRWRCIVAAAPLLSWTEEPAISPPAPNPGE
uniref:Uncharacterized protein n=1 Tax=Mantoniella antarctica TaxID=81844 RepID=A0A7S0SUY8_9CHLO